MEESQVVASRLKEAILVVMNPVASPSERSAGNSLIEQVKSNSDPRLTLRVAFHLIDESSCPSAAPLPLNVNLIRHFGLQLIEKVIKSNWNSMDASNRDEMKEFLMKLLSPEFEERFKERHLKDGISRCVVEVMKRDWPQNWPVLLPTLLNSKRKETVLFIFWRLAEDVGIFYRPANPQRRREMHTEMVANIDLMMGYIADCLTSGDMTLSFVALQTLTGFLEWSCVDQSLLCFLCNVLSTDTELTEHVHNVKIQACDCILICLNRKNLRTEEKKALLVLFNETNFNAVVKTLQVLLATTRTETFSTYAYSLTKKICNVMTSLGQTIVNLGSLGSLSKEVWTFYLSSMHAILSHPNQSISSIGLQFWRDFVRNVDLCREWFNNSLIMELLGCLPTKLMKASHLGVAFEFDGLEEYDAFYYKFRAEIMEFLRNLTLVDEKTCFQCVISVLRNALTCGAQRAEWEVIPLLLDAVCNKLQTIEMFAADGVSLLQSLLSQTKVEDPDTISSQLSCVSALTVFLPQAQGSDILGKLLTMIFNLVVHQKPGQTKQNRTKEVKNLRRHACSCFVKISKTYPCLLLPMFEDLRLQVEKISLQEDELSQMERCTLNEGLLLISNQFNDIRLQEQFIQQLLLPLQWMLSYNLSCEQFISYIGLNNCSEVDDEFGRNRATVLYAINTILGLLKRTTRKQALLPHIVTFLKAMLPLIVNLNSIWRCEHQMMCHSEYRSVVFANITELDKLQLLETSAITPSPEGTAGLLKSPAHRMQSYLWSLHESCFSALGTAIAGLSPEIYDQVVVFLDSLRDAEYLPDWKLRMILKSFIKPLIQKCPPDTRSYETLIVPLVNSFLPFLFRKINSRWEAVTVRSKQLVTDEGQSPERELLDNELVEDQLNRLLSREFVDVIGCLLLPTGSQSKSVANIEMSGEDSEMNAVSDANESAGLSELGSYLLHRACDVIVMTSIVSLTWMDSIASYKASFINLVLIQKLISESLIKSAVEANFLLQHVLQALSYFGEHEQNQSRLLQLALVLYEGVVIRLGLEGAKLGFREAMGCDASSLDGFEEKWIKPSLVGRVHIPEKKKKEALRGLLSTVIGRNIGQLFAQNKAEIKNLQPILFNRRKLSEGKDLTSNLSADDIGLCRLFDS